MVSFPVKEKYNMDDFRAIISVLRHPGGCPWDMEQDHHSIRRNFIEETYEACEAIDTENTELLLEELGDVMMQVLFHASIEEDAGRFDIDDVADHAVKKLIFRHPHVFGSVQVSGTGEVLNNWDELKRKEKQQRSYTDTLNAVAKTLPALWRAEKVQKKAAKSGFDWPDEHGPLQKVREETDEVASAVPSETFEEIGDLLFAVVNLARKLGVDPEDALNGATNKFITRFSRVEVAARSGGTEIEHLSQTEMEDLWQGAKKLEESHYE